MFPSSTRRRFLRGLRYHFFPSLQAQCKIVTFEEEEDDDGGFLILCRELHADATPEANGSWELRFNIFVTTKTWWGRIDEKRKVPSTTLQEKLSAIGIRTKYDGGPIYPSLVGRSRGPVDPHDLLRRMEGLMATVDVTTLYTEPEDENETEYETTVT